MFHCVLQSNDEELALALRRVVATFVHTAWEEKVPGKGLTVEQMLNSIGWKKEQYLESIQHSHFYEEPELVFVARAQALMTGPSDMSRW